MSKHRREADEMDQANDDREQVERLKNQKRQIRQQYRELINDTEGTIAHLDLQLVVGHHHCACNLTCSSRCLHIANRKELMEPSNNGLLENVDRANKLYKSGRLKKSCLMCKR